MPTFERIIAVIGSIITIIVFLQTYWHVINKGSFLASRRRIRKAIAKFKSDGFSPDLLICLGRGGFFVGAIFVDEMNRSIPMFGIDKSYFYESGTGGEIRNTKIEFPESFTIPKVYENASVLLVTGEVVDGGSLLAAADFVKEHMPKSNLREYSLYSNIDARHIPDYVGFEIRGRQKRIPWKTRISPSSSEFLKAK